MKGRNWISAVFHLVVVRWNMTRSKFFLAKKHGRILFLLSLVLTFLYLPPAQAAVAAELPVISDVSDAPDSFSPDGDNQYDTTTIYFTLSENASVTLRIYDAAHILVRTPANDELRSIGANQVVWDGKDDAGTPVPDGLYSYTIEAVDEAGNSAVPQSGDVLVVSRKPLELTSPASGSTLAGTVRLVATQPEDYTFYYYYYNYFYWVCPNGSWFIGYPTRQPDGTWTTDWDTTAVVNGTCEIQSYVTYTDSRGGWKNNVHTSHGAFTVDNGVTITNVSDAPDSFSPDGDNQYDTTTIYFTLSENASVTLRIYDAAHILVRTPANDELRSIGANQVVWDGKDDAGTPVPDGLYSYTIDAVDEAGNSAVPQSGDVLVASRKPLELTSPASGSTLAGTVRLVATQPEDYTFYYYYYNYFFWVCPNGSWFIGYPTRQPDGTWTTDWDTTAVVNGTCEIQSYVTYTDSRGGWKNNVHTSHGAFTVDNGVTITKVSDAPDSFSPEGDNQYDTTTIYFTLSENASVTLRIYDAAHILVRTPAND